MNLSTKTTLSIVTTTNELRASLTAYQSDMMQEIAAVFIRKENNKVPSWSVAAKFGLICMQKSEEFTALVEKTGVLWIDTPKNLSGWVELVENNPYLFGITDEDVTKDVHEVVLVLDGQRHDIPKLISSI